jgi:hypothetical protein
MIGLCGIVITGKSSIEEEPDSSLWQMLGLCLLGLVFLVGSFTALRSRRRAGLLFIVAAPIVAFILAYPAAGFWVTQPNGDVDYILPGPPQAIVLSCVFFAPFLAPLIAIRNRRRAAYLFVISVLLFGLGISLWEKTAVLLSPLAAWSALFVGFGAFWLGTYNLGWPPLLIAEPRPLGRKLATAVFECLLVASLVVVGTFVVTAAQATPWSPDCSGPRLFTQPLRPDHVVFTARLIRVGHVKKVSGKWAGDWAIGLVQEPFWGLPPWEPHLVLITDGIFWEGETYFISGVRADGLLTRILPIVDTARCLGQACPVADAAIYLHLLHRQSSESEVNVIGYVQSPKRHLASERVPEKEGDPNDVYHLVLNRARYTPLGGARIKVVGPSGSTIVTADQDGIYEISGLPPDDYTLTLLDWHGNQIGTERRLQKSDLMQGRPLQLSFWSGKEQ